MLNIFRSILVSVWLLFATLLVFLATTINIYGDGALKYRVFRKVSLLWAKGIIWLSGVECEVEGLDNIKTDGQYIIMSNHLSLLDVPLLISKIPLLCGFIVKSDLMRIPIFSRAMKNIGCVSLNRSSSNKKRSVISNVLQNLNKKKNIIIFPEGKRSLSGQLLSFKTGGAKLAIDSGIPIIPLRIHGTNNVLKPKTMILKPDKLLLRIGNPIVTEKLTNDDKDKLINNVREEIEGLYYSNYEFSNLESHSLAGK